MKIGLGSGESGVHGDMESLWEQRAGKGQRAAAEGQNPFRRAQVRFLPPSPIMRHTHTCQLALQEVAEAQEVVVQNEQKDNDGRHEDGDVH